jgi:hypothetical protein
MLHRPAAANAMRSMDMCCRAAASCYAETRVACPNRLNSGVAPTTNPYGSNRSRVGGFDHVSVCGGAFCADALCGCMLPSRAALVFARPPVQHHCPILSPSWSDMTLLVVH